MPRTRRKTKDRWGWGDWKFARIPAEILGAVIEERGSLTASEFVDLARPPRSTLHSFCREEDWDDRIAGEEHRRTLARTTLNHLARVVVMPNREHLTVRALVAVPGSGKNGSGRRYMPIEVAIQDHPIGWREALGELQRDIKALRARYSAWKELAPILRQVGQAVRTR